MPTAAAHLLLERLAQVEIHSAIVRTHPVVDLASFKILKTISLPAEDEDGIIYDPGSKKVFCFCGDSKVTCVIDPKTLEAVKTIDLGGSPNSPSPMAKDLSITISKTSAASKSSIRSLRPIHQAHLRQQR